MKKKYSRIAEVRARYGNCSTRTVDRGVQQGIIAPPDISTAFVSGTTSCSTSTTWSVRRALRQPRIPLGVAGGQRKAPQHHRAPAKA
jgi:hypothetical protein